MATVVNCVHSDWYLQGNHTSTLIIVCHNRKNIYTKIIAFTRYCSVMELMNKEDLCVTIVEIKLKQAQKTTEQLRKELSFF